MAGKPKWSASQLVVDHYVRNRNKRSVTEYPRLDQVLKAVELLDGGATSSMAIAGTDGSVAAIGGGPQRYHMSVTTDRGVFILTSKQGEDEVSLIIGGVKTPMPAKYVIDIDCLKMAVAEFYNSGKLSSDLSWEES